VADAQPRGVTGSIGVIPASRLAEEIPSDGCRLAACARLLFLISSEFTFQKFEFGGQTFPVDVFVLNELRNDGDVIDDA
jgi:hypothetical protein